MGLQTVPAYIGKTGYTHPVETDRNILRSVSGARTGLVRFGDFAITPTGVSGQLSIARGAAYLLGVESNLQGSYHVWSDAAVTASFAAASGNPRIDSLILRVSDDQYGTIPGSPQAYLEVVQGIAAGSPVARADSYFNSGGGAYVPGAWFRLADVRRNIGDTTIPSGQITHNKRYSRYTIGDMLIPDGSSFPTDPVTRDEVVRVDTGMRYYYDGTVWIPVGGQLVYGWARGAAQATNNKLVSNLSGQQVAFTTPSVALDANMSYYLTSSVYQSSGSVGTPKYATSWIDAPSGTMVASSGIFMYNNVDNMRTGVNRLPYFNGATTSMAFVIKTNETSSTAYDIVADPTRPAWFLVETTGFKASQFAV
jgi:hypothetical protein